MVQAAADADILIFVVPHQFIGKICDQLKGHLKANTIGISLIKVPGTPSCGLGGGVVQLTFMGLRVGKANRTENGRNWSNVPERREELVSERIKKVVRSWGCRSGV